MTQYTDDLTRDLRELEPSDKAQAIASEVDRIAKERDDFAEELRRLKASSPTTDDHATHALGVRIRAYADQGGLPASAHAHKSKMYALAAEADRIAREGDALIDSLRQSKARADSALRQFSEAETARLEAEAKVFRVEQVAARTYPAYPRVYADAMADVRAALDGDDQTAAAARAKVEPPRSEEEFADQAEAAVLDHVTEEAEKESDAFWEGQGR